jgi:hypothetical protein
MDVVSVPLCRKPFAPVDEQFLPELKALAEQLMQRNANPLPDGASRIRPTKTRYVAAIRLRKPLSGVL